MLCCPVSSKVACRSYCQCFYLGPRNSQLHQHEQMSSVMMPAIQHDCIMCELRTIENVCQYARVFQRSHHGTILNVAPPCTVELIPSSSHPCGMTRLVSILMLDMPWNVCSAWRLAFLYLHDAFIVDKCLRGLYWCLTRVCASRLVPWLMCVSVRLHLVSNCKLIPHTR